MVNDAITSLSTSPVNYTFRNSQLFWSDRSRYVIHAFGGPASLEKLRKPRKSQDECWKIPPEISIVGVSRIRNNDYSRTVRFVWFCALAVCAGFCCYQLKNCTSKFLEQPIVKNVEIVRVPRVHFPALYLCPVIKQSINNPVNCISAEKYQGKTDHSCFEDPIINVIKEMVDEIIRKNVSHNVEKLWDFSYLVRSAVHIYRPCNSSDENCTVYGARWNVDDIFINTFWGRCLALNTVQHEDFRGPFTYFMTEIKNSFYTKIRDTLKQELKNATDERTIKNIKRAFARHSIGAMFYLHEKFIRGLYHKLYFSLYDVLQGYHTHVELRRQKFEMLDRRTNRCITDKKHIDCRNICFEKLLSKKCRMPYDQTSTHVRKCTFKDDFYQIHAQNSEVYSNFNPDKCSCLPPCKEVKYIPSVDVVSKLRDEEDTIRIKFYFADNTYESTVEKLTYEYTAFLSDIGGNLGFFLGFCILNVLELIEFIIYLTSKMKLE